MAKSKFTRAPKPPAEQIERATELAECAAAPANSLVESFPAMTIGRCVGVIHWLAQVKQPDMDDAHDAALADVLYLVAEALEHAEKTIRLRYRLDDDPETIKLAREAAHA